MHINELIAEEGLFLSRPRDDASDSPPLYCAEALLS